MHLSNLEIKNFRGLKYLKVDDLKMVNVFLGKNNVGKTSILEAIFVSLSPSNPQSVINIDAFRNLLHINSEDFRFPFYHLNYDNIVEINSAYHNNDIEKGLKISPISKPSLAIQPNQNFSVDNSSINNNQQNLVNGLNLTYSYKKRHSKQQYHTAKIELENNVFKQTPVLNIESMTGLIVTQNTLYNQFSNRLEKILINKQENEIIEFLKPVDPSIQGLSLGTNNIILVDTGFGKRYPINLLGDGVIKLIAILLDIYEVNGGVLLIDEFSNGLHHSALNGLWKAILLAAKANNVQVFLTTHDYEALTHLKNLLKDEPFVQFQEEIRAYTIRKLPDNTLKSYLYDYSKLEIAIDEENEIR